MAGIKSWLPPVGKPAPNGHCRIAPRAQSTAVWPQRYSREKGACMAVTRRIFLLGALGGAASLAGCVGGRFQTYFANPVAPGVSRDWRVADVAVTVPATLVVSEAKTLLPTADIVWREDPPGDRYAQVDAIMTEAARQGAAGLRGGRPVRLSLTVTRFHALTFEAETRLSRSGVHNIDFVAQVTDARSGAVLAGPEAIEAALPALSGDEMRAARARGQTQKSQITAHVRATVAAWLGAGPDNRGTFTRSGN
jgi:hypothetical protein